MSVSVTVQPRVPRATPPRAWKNNPQAIFNKAARVFWGIVWTFLFRPSPQPFFWWRRLLLRVFGARLSGTALVYPSVKVWAPWNLEMGSKSCLGPDVDCYSVDAVIIGPGATVSQYSHLCTATHDPYIEGMPLVTAPISIGHAAWVAAGAFVGPGVMVKEGAVVGARSVALKDVHPWTVVAGNPARLIKNRVVEKMIGRNS